MRGACHRRGIARAPLSLPSWGYRRGHAEAAFPRAVSSRKCLLPSGRRRHCAATLPEEGKPEWAGVSPWPDDKRGEKCGRSGDCEPRCRGFIGRLELIPKNGDHSDGSKNQGKDAQGLGHLKRWPDQLCQTPIDDGAIDDDEVQDVDKERLPSHN